jgi:hypothetical protein
LQYQALAMHSHPDNELAHAEVEIFVFVCLRRCYIGQWETHSGNKTATAGKKEQHAKQQA